MTQEPAESVSPPASPESLGDILAGMRSAAAKAGPPAYDARIAHLDKLDAALRKHVSAFVDAAATDFGTRSRHETLSAEVMFLLGDIKHARENLQDWMETEPRDVPWMFFPARAEVVMQPVGTVGIIGAWNYPFQLTLSPLVSALAAGNRVMIKPSELAPASAEAIAKFVREVFDEDHVRVVLGGADVAQAFAGLAFDHLVFTGSTRVGKLVMRAAAENLVPVTLELGGKSPAIVSSSYKISEFADKIAFGKCFNGGQTCVAPDYVLVPRASVGAFVEAFQASVWRMYPSLADNRDYTAIINEAHYRRLLDYLHDAIEKGAAVVEVNPQNETLSAETRKIAPTVITGVTDSMSVMQEEIFGPLLPVVPYDSLDDALAFVAARPRPLSLYYFDHDQARIDRVLRATVSGGVTINDVMMHVIQPDLPFGGAGASGMGAYHGKAGFDAMTQKKPVFYQSRLSGSPLLRPPYASRADWMLKILAGG